MALFENSVEIVLSNEGGFVDNPHDSGGATNFGLSLRFLRQLSLETLRKYGIFVAPEDLNVEHVKELTLDQAKNIYKGEFWDNAPYEKITIQKVADYIFDMAVNHGEHQAIKIAQRAIWASYAAINVIKDDGIFGDETLVAIDYLQGHILPCLRSERAGFMRLLAVKISKDEEFLNGWLNRCYRI